MLGRPDIDSAAKFLARLAALVKFAINQKGGAVGLEALAAAMGERERTVQAGLRLLRALAKIDYHVAQSGEYHLRYAQGAPSGKLEMLQQRLELLLRETRAYRKFWRTMEIGG